MKDSSNECPCIIHCMAHQIPNLGLVKIKRGKGGVIYGYRDRRLEAIKRPRPAPSGRGPGGGVPPSPFSGGGLFRPPGPNPTPGGIFIMGKVNTVSPNRFLVGFAGTPQSAAGSARDGHPGPTGVGWRRGSDDALPHPREGPQAFCSPKRALRGTWAPVFNRFIPTITCKMFEEGKTCTVADAGEKDD